MKVEYVHASKYGNGAVVGARFAHKMADRGHTVEVRRVDEMDPGRMPEADLYVFSSPGRIGRPRRQMCRFLRKLTLPAGTRYALMTTEIVNPGKHQRVHRIMRELLDAHGYECVGEETITVVAIRGPMEEAWEHKVEDFATALAPVAA